MATDIHEIDRRYRVSAAPHPAATSDHPPEHRQPQPGAPVGGHDQHGGHGHEGHSDHADMFRRRFWWSLVLTIPIVLTSHMVMDWVGYDLEFRRMEWIGPVLGSVTYFWAGWPFLEGAVDEVRHRAPGMMTLIALAITVAFGASLATSAGWFDLEFWWELAALVTIMLLGHWQEMKALGQATDALDALATLLPDEAEVVANDRSIRTVPVALLSVGSIVLVRPGSRVPADGEIVAGTAELDESMITGESRPALRRPGERVVAGTVAMSSALRVRVDAVGDDTALAGIQRLIADARRSKSRAQALADRAAALLFYVAVAAGIATFTVWSLLGDIDRAVTFTVGVLVISCPHALGLAIPLVISLSSALASRSGILVKDRLALERMRQIDVVLFDKTGTLTKGSPAVASIVGNGIDADEVLRIAGAVEADSEHPLARAVVCAAAELGSVPLAHDFRSMMGRGVEASVGGDVFAVGGPSLIAERGLDEPAAIFDTLNAWRSRGATVLYLIRNRTVLGAMALDDEIRPEAREAVRDLKALGRGVVMITGDARQVAGDVATRLGIDEVFSEVLPEHKDGKVAELQRRGLLVAMVGDGVNDAPALARADVGMAIGAGTEVAIESAGVILALSDPRSVVSVITLSRASYRKMVQNLVWAAGYNVAAIPLAAGAFAWAGVTLSPAVGAALMSLSTIVVALNAQLLRRVDLRPQGSLDSRPPSETTSVSFPTKPNGDNR